MELKNESKTLFIPLLGKATMSKENIFLHDPNAEIKYGIDTPEEFLSLNKKLEYIATHIIKRDDNNLHGLTKFIFNNLYCGKLSQSIYRIYEFNLKK